MKIKKGQDQIRIPDLHTLLTVAILTNRHNNEGGEVWEPVLRIQPQTLAGDPVLRGEGRPRCFVLSGDTLYLFPVPNRDHEIEVTYHVKPRRV